MSHELIKKGAKAVTDELDKIADLFQSHHTELGVPEKIGMDFAFRCDLLSDNITNRAKTAYQQGHG